MKASLDGEMIFSSDELNIEVGSLQRESIEKGIFGLDGILSIDLGSRGRLIKQKGILRALGYSEMQSKINVINSFFDGDTHKFVTDMGVEFNNVKISSFKVGKNRISGRDVFCDYEIIYNQLVV